MTIKVEQETLIALQSQSWPISNENDDYILRLPRKESYRVASHEYNSPLVDKSLCTHSTDDEDSVYTESTASFSDADSDFDRRVSFADDLVTDMWTRPFTEKDEISNLYYSNDETIRYVRSLTLSVLPVSVFETMVVANRSERLSMRGPPLFVRPLVNLWLTYSFFLMLQVSSRIPHGKEATFNSDF